VDDRVLHKRYLEERDFANKHPYLLNFSGDPFRQLHDARTMAREGPKQAAVFKTQEMLQGKDHDKNTL